MKNKRVLYLISCLSFGVLTIMFLALLAKQSTLQKNDFSRVIYTNVVQNARSINIGVNSYYIAGVTSEHVFLGNYSSPQNIITSNYTLTDTQRILLNIPDQFKIAWRALTLKVDSPDIYVMDGISPNIFHATLDNLHFEKYETDQTSFTLSLPISRSTFIMRTFDKKTHQNILAKQTVNPLNLKRSYSSLQKQVDGYFCTDGILQYDPFDSHLIYLYYYRNQYVGLDTNLNVLFRGATIDTISHAHIKLDTIKSENRITLSSPPQFVNKHCCIYRRNLYVHSALLADNEQFDQFENNAVIDVYSLNTQKYKYSFYIPEFKNIKLTEFKVVNNTIIALYDDYLVTFDLNLNNLE